MDLSLPPEVGKVLDGAGGGRTLGSSALNIILGDCRLSEWMTRSSDRAA